MSSVHVHQWEPIDNDQPGLVRCADQQCPLSRRTVTLTRDGAFLDYALMLDNLIGPGPWTINIQLVDAGGRIVAEKKIDQPLTFNDKAHIVIGPSDVEVSTSA